MPYFTFTYTKVVLARKSRRTYGVQKPYKSILYNKKSTTFTIPFRINIMVSLWCRWWNPEPRRARLRKRWQQTAPTESKEGVSHAVCSNRSPINQHQKTEGTPSGYPLFLVPVVGLEPTRCRHQRILSPSRLPIPSHRRISCRPIGQQIHCTILFSKSQVPREHFFTTSPRDLTAGKPLPQGGEAWRFAADGQRKSKENTRVSSLPP